MSYRGKNKTEGRNADKKKKSSPGTKESVEPVVHEPMSVKLAAVEAVEDMAALRRLDREKKAKRKAAHIKANNGIAVGNVSAAQAPLWTVRFNEKFGHLTGRVLYLVMLLILVPLIIPATWMAMRLLAHSVVGDLFPRSTLEDMGTRADTVLSSQDNFFLGWTMPVFFCTIFLAIVLALVYFYMIRWAIRWFMRLRAGLYAGYPETTWDNMLVRRATRQMRGKERKRRKTLKRQDRARVDRDVAAVEKIEAGKTPED